MTTERELTEAVRTWLQEGATRVPDRVLDAVLDEVPGIMQRGPVWQVWRPGARRRALAVAALVAGLAVAVASTSRLLPGPVPNFGNVGPSSAPSVSAGPPSASPPALEVPVSGPMSGRYIVPDVDRSGIGFEFTVPAGWSSCCSHYTEKANGTTQFNPWVIGLVFRDPCRRETGELTAASTVAGLADQLLAQPGRSPVQAEPGPSASAGGTTSPSARPAPEVPTPVTVDGFSGVRIQLQVPFDTIITSCTNREYVGWSGAIGPEATRYNQNPGQVDDLRIVDVGGTPFVIHSAYDQSTSAADRAELDAILDTVDIIPPPAAPGSSASFVATQPPGPAQP